MLKRAEPGSISHIGGNDQVENIDIVYKLWDLIKELAEDLPYLPRDLITFVTDRLGHDRRYAVDVSKIKHEIGWSPTCSFDEGL